MPALVDPEILRAWLTGWALARHLPPPVPVPAGFRVDVGWPEQRRRFVYPALTPEVSELAGRVRDPWVFIKVCTTTDDLSERISEPWCIQQERVLMTLGGEADTRRLSDRYQLDISDEGAIVAARIRSATGVIAAQGEVVGVDDFAIYNGVHTHPDHRREGLASALMTALLVEARTRRWSKGLLVATPAGRRLYEHMGWTVQTPYATAVIPGAVA